MPSSPLIVACADGVVTLTLTRPGQRNAIDPDMCEALNAALDQAATDEQVRALILIGAGGTFCAGGDLGRFDELHDPGAYRWVSHRLSAMIDSFERIEKPTVAVIDGVAAGAGLALAMTCDWRIGTARTRLLYAEGRIGLVATHGGCARLVKLVGLARAREAMLGGDELDAAAGSRIGLISEIAEAEPIALARTRIDKMLARSPLSYASAKRLLTLAADTDVRSGMVAEGLAQAALLMSEDHREGLAAAGDRRAPRFVAR